MDCRAVAGVILDLVDDEVAVERVLALGAAVLEFLGLQGLLDRNRLGGRSLGGGDVALIRHAVEDHVAANLPDLRVCRRVVADWLLNQPCESRCLWERDLRCADVEVSACGRFDSVGTGTEVADVEVALEDLLFGHLLLDRQCVAHLLQLAPDRAHPSVFDLLFGLRVGNELVTDVLHCDRGASLLHVTGL